MTKQVRNPFNVHMSARRGLAGFGAGLIAVLAGAVLSVQAIQQSVRAVEAPSVELTSQEILTLPSKNTRLIWLEINPGGYKVESLNHHPLPLSGPDCHKDMAFSPRLSGDRFQQGKPLVFSWAIRADIQWLCLEMIATRPPSQATYKLYAALQVIKPEIKITDRPTVEITSRQNLSSPGGKLIWIKILGNGFNVKNINYHPLPLTEPDCHENLAFSSLIQEDRLGGKQELNMSLAISSKTSYFCVEVLYADSAGQAAPKLYLPIPVEEVVEPRIAEFVLQSGPPAQTPDQPDQLPAITDTNPVASPVGNDDADGGGGVQPARPGSNEVIATVEVPADGQAEREVAEEAVSPARSDKAADAGAGTDNGDGSIWFKIFAFVVAGAVVLALSILLVGNRR